MNKGIGFRRNIYLSWLDAAAALCAEESDPARIRVRLDPIVEQQIKSKENRRMALDILLNIWVKTAETHPTLRAQAVALFASSEAPESRLWLHYGLTLLSYDFFRLCAATIGQISQYSDVITPKAVKKRIFAELGQLGALDKATERVIFSLRDWGILAPSPTRYAYAPLRGRFTMPDESIEEWLLAAALTASPAEEIPFIDLIHLPELFPFQFTCTLEQLRRGRYFEVQRQGMSWDMVRLVPHAKAPLSEITR